MAFREKNISEDWKGAFSMAINPFLLMAKINGHQQGYQHYLNISQLYIETRARWRHIILE